MRVLLDMNIPFKYAPLIKEKGIEVLRWQDAGAPDAADIEIMAYARNND